MDTFFYSKICVLIYTKNWVGLHFGRLFHRVIWSPWLLFLRSALCPNYWHFLETKKLFSLSCEENSKAFNPMNSSLHNNFANSFRQALQSSVFGKARYRIIAFSTLPIKIFPRTRNATRSFALFYNFSSLCSEIVAIAIA
jgi:hypothetical protein